MMSLTSEEVEYDVAEFYQRFSDSLPKIVKVSQGFCGDINEDTFDRNQIIRLHTISHQKRVVAKTELWGELKYISIPLNYQNMKLCVLDKKGNVGKERDLADIVKKEKALPVNVQFPEDKTITFGNVTVRTSHLPKLELTHVFEEIYLLGNFVNDGEMSSEVIHVPLYLTQLRLALVTGIADQPLQAWDQLQASLSEVARELQYNKDFGNPEMAEYSTASFVDTSTDIYSYITPSQYYNFLPLVDGNKSFNSKGSKEPKTKDSKRRVNAETKRASNKNTKFPTKNKTNKNQCENVTVHEDNDAVLSTGNDGIKELTESGENLYEFLDDIDTKTDPVVKKSIDNSKKEQERDYIGSGNIPQNLPPPIPPRPSLEKPKLEQSKKSKERNHYENNLPRGRVAPIIKSKEKDENTVHSTTNLNQNELKTNSETTSKMRTTSKAMLNSQLHAESDQKSTTVDNNQQYTEHENEHLQNITLENKSVGGNVCKPKVEEAKESKPVKKTDDNTKLTIDDTQLHAESDKKSTTVDSNQPDTKHENEQIQKDTLENKSVDGDVCKPKVEEAKEPQPLKKPDDITKLTIDGVSQYLRALRLEAYIEEFRNQQVDGELLPELDRDILKNEFGMKAVEAARLLKFVTKGHIPK